jgi:hypothetical protein
MDREAAVIRAEMSQTRAALDHKITRLEARAKQMTPRALSRRYMPDYFVDRAIGGVLTLIGIRMAWRMYKGRARHRGAVRTMASAYERW